MKIKLFMTFASRLSCSQAKQIFFASLWLTDASEVNYSSLLKVKDVSRPEDKG